MEKIKEFGVWISLVFATLTSWLGAVAIPFYVLVLLVVSDYITGITVAPERGEKRNSKKGFKGIVKKIFILSLVGLGALIDLLLGYVATSFGITMPLKMFMSVLVAIWLCCNEIVSILENIAEMDVDIPPFLRVMVEWLQKTTEEKGDIKKGGE